MKALSVLQIISSKEWGGREQHVKELSAGLLQQGHRVIIVTRNNPEHIARYEQAAEVEVMPLRNLLDCKSLTRLAELIKKREVDCVHVHTGRDAWLALLATKIAGCGKVFNSRHTVSKPKTDIVHRWYYNKLAAVICVSEMVRREFLETCPIIEKRKAVVVYNGIDTEKFLQSETRKPFESQPIVLGYAGRISPEKGLEHLIEALKIIKKQSRANLKLLLVGKAKEDYRRMLEDKVVEYALSESVEFCGFKENVAEFMNKIDIFILPCVWQEAFGLVLCEAMVCGRPVISTQAGAQSELITSGQNGLLVKQISGAAIAESIISLLNDPEAARKMGEQGKKEVLKRFTLTHMVDRMVECYRKFII